MKKGTLGNRTPETFFIATAVICCGSSAALASFTSAGANYSVTSSAGTASCTNVPTEINSYSWVNNGGWSANGASVTWTNNYEGVNPQSGLGFLNANMVIRNNTSSAQDFTITAAMLGFETGPFIGSGSVGGQFVNGSSSLGMLTSTGPLWSAAADGSNVNTQLNNALFFAQPYQIVSLGNFNFSNIAFSGIDNHAAIKFSFRLSAGGEASFTSVFAFQAIPAPAVLALIVLMPVTRSRRRR